MIRIESKKLSSEECQILAEVTKSVRRGTAIESERSVDEIAENIKRFSKNKDFRVLVAFDGEGNIVGWTYHYVGFRLMTFISGFFPIVDQSRDIEKIALSLIEAAKSDLVERDHSRLEIELELPTDAHRALSESVVDWYQKSGFEFAAEEVHMTSNLTLVDLPELDSPKECTLRKFSDASYEQLEEAGYQTFENSQNDLFLSMDRDEQKVNIDHFFDKSKPFIEDASLILEQEGTITGFVITRLKNGEPELGPVGLIPEARGQGLANYLLVCVLKNLRDNGQVNVGLDMSIINHPARKLYERYGFKDVYYKQFYYWSP